MLSHLALFYFLVWLYFTYSFGGSLFSKMYWTQKVLAVIFAVIRTFTLYNRYERPLTSHRLRHSPVLCFPLQLSAAFGCITASYRSVCHLIFPLFYTGQNPFPVSFPAPYFAASSTSERRSIHLKNDSMEEKKQLIPTAEAAAFLGIKVSYLHKLMMRRVIPYYKPNGKLCFFDKAELEAWLKNVRIASQTELDQQAQAYIVNRAKGGKP